MIGLEQFLRRTLLVLVGLLLLETLILLPPMAWRIWSDDGTMYWLKCVAQDPIDTIIYGRWHRNRCQNSLKQIALANHRYRPEPSPPELPVTYWEATVANPFTVAVLEPSTDPSWKAQEAPHLRSGALGGIGWWEDNLKVLRPWAYTEAYYALNELP